MIGAARSASGAALQVPDRVARLVLFNTGAFPPPFIPWRIRACRIPWLGPWAVRRLNLFALAALRMAVNKPERMTAAVRAGLLAPYDSWEHRVAIERFVADIPASSRHPTWQVLADIERGLPSLANRPVQLIWGMRDWCFRPACLDRFLQLFPAAETHRLTDASHYVIEDAHEQIIPLVERFLDCTSVTLTRGWFMQLRNSPATEAPLSIGQCATLACLLEASAPKPGNVHRGCRLRGHDLHRFRGQRRRDRTRDGLGRPSSGVGAAVLAAVQATRRLVPVNTNLGTVLLLAPLAAVPRPQRLNAGIRDVLRSLTARDAEAVYAAIRLAEPGGLGSADQMDVAEAAPESLLAAMAAAADRDLVARQYAEGFVHVLDHVVPLARRRARGRMAA